MDKLIELITNSLGKSYPEIKEGDVITPPCFVLTPYGLNGLKGNGIPVENTVSYEICVFTYGRMEALAVSLKMKNDLAENGYACTDPYIEYEKNAKSWKIIIQAEGILERNDETWAEA